MKFLRMLLKINKEEDKESDEDILYELNEVNKINISLLGLMIPSY